MIRFCPKGQSIYDRRELKNINIPPLQYYFMRIDNWSTTLNRLERSKEGSAMIQLITQKISEDHGLLPNA
jgi:hypothetical protein